MCRVLLSWLLVAGFVPAAAAAAALSKETPVRDADRVVVVRNENSPASRAVAEDYAIRRAVRNVLSVRCQDSAASPENETISYTAYQQAVEKPLREFLSAHASIDFIVLTKGIPIRIERQKRDKRGDKRVESRGGAVG